MNSTSKKLIDALKICVIALALTLGVNYVFAWVGAPSGGPTNCPAGHVGCDAPINVSTSAQTKNGQLTVTNLWGSFVGSTAGGYFATRLGIGPNASTSGSATLDVDGTIQIRGGSPANGKVLVASDANGNANWVSTSTLGFGVSTGTSVGSNFFHKMQSFYFPPRSGAPKVDGFPTASWTVNVPTAGNYAVSVSGSSQTRDDNVRTRLYCNGVMVQQADFFANDNEVNRFPFILRENCSLTAGTNTLKVDVEGNAPYLTLAVFDVITLTD